MNVEEELEVQQNATPEQVMPGYNKEALEAAIKEYETKQNDVETKLYIIEGGLAYADAVKKWLASEAKWNYSECVAVTKLYSEFKTAIANIQSGKTEGKLVLTAAPITALNYMFQKIEGKGFQSAEKFRDLVMPILDVINSSIGKDNEILKRLEFKIETLKQGLEPSENLMDGLEDDTE